MESGVHGRSMEILVHGRWVNFALSIKPKSPVEAGLRFFRWISNVQSDVPAINPWGHCVREVVAPGRFQNLLQQSNEETLPLTRAAAA